MPFNWIFFNRIILVIFFFYNYSRFRKNNCRIIRHIKKNRTISTNPNIIPNYRSLFHTISYGNLMRDKTIFTYYSVLRNYYSIYSMWIEYWCSQKLIFLKLMSIAISALILSCCFFNHNNKKAFIILEFVRKYNPLLLKYLLKSNKKIFFTNSFIIFLL